MVEHSENQRKWLQAAILAGHIISIPFATFDQAEIVARGAFGEVSRAYWKSAEKTVALKSLYNNPVMGTEGSFEEFVKEVIFDFFFFFDSFNQNFFIIFVDFIA